MKRRSFLAQTLALAFAGSAGAAEGLLPDITARTTIDPVLQKALGDLVPQWITKSADAVRRYYGKFPVPVLDLKVQSADGAHVADGHSDPGPIPVISVDVGKECSTYELLHQDWVLVHEMIHMAIPYVPRREFWAAEGLAVYVESICRIQAGHIKAEMVFADFVKNMPRGLPKTGEGLSSSRDHGRVYWGGALYFLVADVRMRRETGNRLGLQTALRAINAKHDFRDEMAVARFFPLGDKATGTKVLMQLYEELAMKGGSPDLGALWASLGVVGEGANLQFDDSAPEAAIRKAILRPMA